ncbi:MAG: hypothetical protein ACLUIS_08515 [Longibaculum sp.]
MDKKKQMSDTMRLGVLLAIAGGFLDAYTYLVEAGFLRMHDWKYGFIWN